MNKCRGCLWSAKRIITKEPSLLYNLSKILSEKFSDRLFSTVDKIYRNIIPHSAIDTIVTNLPLTAFQANKGSKNCKVYKCSSAKIPYSDAAVTLGRKVIRDLCGIKSFNHISYN